MLKTSEETAHQRRHSLLITGFALVATLSVPAISFGILGRLPVWAAYVDIVPSMLLGFALLSFGFYLLYKPPSAPDVNKRFLRNLHTGEEFVLRRVHETLMVDETVRTRMVLIPAQDRFKKTACEKVVDRNVFERDYAPAIDQVGDEYRKFHKYVLPASLPMGALVGLWLCGLIKVSQPLHP